MIPTPDNEDIEDIVSYGVDWEVNDNETIMTHLLENNPQDWEEETHSHLLPLLPSYLKSSVTHLTAPSKLNRSIILILV
jgi:hypothetical protein